MNAVETRQQLLEHVNTIINVKSTCNNKIYKGFLQTHGASWQLTFDNGEKQYIYFPTFIVDIVDYNPFTIRIKN